MFLAFNTRNRVKICALPSSIKGSFFFIMKSLIVICKTKYLVLNITIWILDLSEMSERKIRHSRKHYHFGIKSDTEDLSIILDSAELKLL